MGLLKSKGLNETPFRKNVLDVLIKESRALSLKDFEVLLDDYDRVTLYRTLKSFMKKGIVHEIKMNDKSSCYAVCKETCSSEEHHHQHIHFKCHKCAQISCVELHNFPNINLPDFTIDTIEIQAYGICANCKE